MNIPLVANAVELFIDFLEGNLILGIKHILVPLLTEVFLNYYGQKIRQIHVHHQGIINVW